MLSPDYRRLQEKLHKTGHYGLTALTFRNQVSKLITTYDINTILDYGCGSNRSLLRALTGYMTRECIYQGYDPCVLAVAEPPKPNELVVSIDVLEHIEPEYLETVLDHLQELTQKILYVSICTIASPHIMEDGRNAHLIQRPAQWWLPKLMDRFDFIEIERIADTSFTFLASCKN